MEKDFEIEIEAEEETADLAATQLPINFLSFGEIGPNDVKVYIKQDTYKALEKYAATDTTKELGAILIGDYCQQHGKTHVVISDYIKAKYTDASSSTLTFTHETWDYIHKQHETRFPDKKIIGWQHTHPNYGIFLSNYDLFIQENFFNMPFQVAYVIDPVQNLRGFFQWQDEKTEKLRGYYIYDEVGKPIKIEQTKVQEKPQKSEKSSKGLTAFVAVLCILTLGMGIFAINLNKKFNEQTQAQKMIEMQLQQQEQIISDQKESVADLQNQLVNAVLDDDGTATAQDLINRIENNEIVIANQDEVLKQLQDKVDAEEETGESVRFVAYTVEAGDTLTSICSAYGLDYGANKAILLSLNGIADENAIFAGQVIILPSY